MNVNDESGRAFLRAHIIASNCQRKGACCMRGMNLCSHGVVLDGMLREYGDMVSSFAPEPVTALHPNVPASAVTEIAQSWSGGPFPGVLG